ncbi:MAG: tyrosine-type recombinase/integrase [Vicinamibacterales bacterium]|nr:tyrosine-type recombinase/integrase [Vicinamibacterales bacterium]
MARKIRSETVRVTECPGRPSPWRAEYKVGTGKGRKRKTTWFKTRELADRFAADLTAALAAADGAMRPPAAVVTFETFAETWRKDIVSRRKPATQRSYEQILRTHVYPHLGTMPVTDAALGVTEVVGVITKAAEAGASWGLQKAILRVISTALSWARRTQKLSTNPAMQLIKTLKDDSNIEYDEPEPNPLTAAQAEAFLVWLRTGVGADAEQPPDGPRLRPSKHRPAKLRSMGYPEWYPYFLTLLRTGMRRGEAAALRWEYLRLTGHRPQATLKKNDSPSARRAGLTGDQALKTKRPHEIDLAPAVVEALRGLQQAQREAALKRGKKASPYVFVGLRGGRVTADSSTADRVFEKGMKAIGLTPDGHTMHDLRDTFATSHLLQNPAKLFWVSWMLGHKSTATTLNRYARWIPALEGGQQFAAELDTPFRRFDGESQTREGGQ